MIESIFRGIINVFKITELRNKILFTLGMLAVYRLGFWIPIPGINQGELAEFFQNQQSGSTAANVLGWVAMFSGGQLSQSTIFGLGIMPYISAAIIFQLLGSAVPAIKKLQEEGPTGRQKVQEWTRYATVGLCIVQSFAWLSFIRSNPNLVYAEMQGQLIWWVMAITAMTAGTMFLMWLSEQIDRYGIGNGASLIITAGILTSMPAAVMQVYRSFGPGEQGMLGWPGLIALVAGFIVVTAGAVLMTVAQRRIPIQQAKHTRGRRVYGGQRSYLPLRVNHSGVMPIIFASSLMIFPPILFQGLANAFQSMAGNSTPWWLSLTLLLNDWFQFGEFPYLIVYIVLVYFFAYFWITVQFSPEDMSKQLRESGSFIPGLRPGPRTAEYLEAVMERITFVGAAFLAVIAIIPMIVNRALGIDFMVTQFLGGTGLLIVVSVCLDFVQRVEANLLMRNYAGFLGGTEEGKSRRLRGPRG